MVLVGMVHDVHDEVDEEVEAPIRDEHDVHDNEIIDEIETVIQVIGLDEVDDDMVVHDVTHPHVHDEMVDCDC